jgi:hypothetical protein
MDNTTAGYVLLSGLSYLQRGRVFYALLSEGCARLTLAVLELGKFSIYSNIHPSNRRRKDITD